MAEIMPRTDEELYAFEEMVRSGGGFVSALGQAALRADLDNLARIRAAFPEYLERYTALAKTRRMVDRG